MGRTKSKLALNSKTYEKALKLVKLSKNRAKSMKSIKLSKNSAKSMNHATGSSPLIPQIKVVQVGLYQSIPLKVILLMADFKHVFYAWMKMYRKR